MKKASREFSRRACEPKGLAKLRLRLADDARALALLVAKVVEQLDPRGARDLTSFRGLEPTLEFRRLGRCTLHLGSPALVLAFRRGRPEQSVTRLELELGAGPQAEARVQVFANGRRKAPSVEGLATPGQRIIAGVATLLETRESTGLGLNYNLGASLDTLQLPTTRLKKSRVKRLTFVGGGRRGGAAIFACISRRVAW